MKENPCQTNIPYSDNSSFLYLSLISLRKFFLDMSINCNGAHKLTNKPYGQAPSGSRCVIHVRVYFSSMSMS